MKSLAAMYSRFPARLRLATVKAVVPVVLAGSLLMATGLVQAAAPTAEFGWSPTVPRVNQSVDFTASAADEVDGDAIASIVWDFGGGATGSGENVQHSFASPGTKSVTMTVTDAADESTEVTHQLRVNAPPSASFTAGSPISVGQNVPLDASNTTDDAALSDGGFEWDLDNDGDYDDDAGRQVTASFSSSGQKTIRLRVTDSDGESDGATQTVTVLALNAPPQAAFDFSPTRPNVNQSVSFDGSGSSDDQPIASTDYDWDLDGDGQYDDATGPTPTTSYGSPGGRTVGLRVTDLAGESDTVSHSLVVNAPPSAAFGFTPPAPVTGQVVSFNGSASSDDLTLAESAFAWDLDGDSQFDDATGRQPSTTYAIAGTRTVGLRVTDSGGVADVQTASVTVTLANTPPQPAFTISPVTPSPDVGDVVSMNATGTTDDKSLTATSYEWDFDNDGQYDDATGVTPTTTFATAGAKTIGLRVTDSDNAAAAVTHPVTVLANATPVPRATFTPARPNPTATTTFNASTSTDDDPIPANAYAWDFDNDGQYDDGTGVSATSSFATSGAKTVGLRVTDANAVAGTATISVPVNRAPTAGFNLAPQTPRVGETVTFTSAATDDVALPAATPTGPVTWDLDNDGQFDDGTGNSVTRAYGAAGDQVVRMRVQDAGGLATIGTKTFPVQQFLPTASFTSSPAHPLPGQTVTFKSTSAPSPGAQITNQEWDLDGISGIDATGAVVTTIYRTAGRRTVTLKVTDTQGFDIATAPVAVNAPPSAAFRVSPTQPYVGDAVTFASVSGDPDGPLPTEAWDLDGDGQYDDATGKTASRTFTTAGAHTVRLRVIDSAGAAGAATLTLNVRPRPLPPVTELPQLATRVRVTSQRGRTSALIRTLGVRAPRGATVKVKCIGRGCPKRGASSTRSKGKVMRVKWLEHRLRAGTRITISVTRKGYIGSYTSLVVRRSKGIARNDLCLLPNKKKPGGCPS